MVHLWEESVDVCTWGIRPLTRLSIRRQLPSLLFYVLKFHLEFEVCCFKKQFESITPRPWVHPLVRQLSRSKARSWGQLRPCLCYFLYLLPLGWTSISCHLRFSNRCLLCQLHARRLNLWIFLHHRHRMPLRNFPGNSSANDYPPALGRAIGADCLWRLRDLVTWALCWGFTGVIFKIFSTGYYGRPTHQQGCEPLFSNTHVFSVCPACMILVQKQGITSKHTYQSLSDFLTCDQGLTLGTSP